MSFPVLGHVRGVLALASLLVLSVPAFGFVSGTIHVPLALPVPVTAELPAGDLASQLAGGGKEEGK